MLFGNAVVLKIEEDRLEWKMSDVIARDMYANAQKFVDRVGGADARQLSFPNQQNGVLPQAR